MVCRRKQASAFSVWLRTFVYDVPLLRLEGEHGQRDDHQLYGEKYRQSGGDGNRRSLRGAPRKHRGTAEAAGRLGQSESERRREQRSERVGETSVSFGLRREFRQLEACTGQIYVYGGRLLTKSATGGKAQLEIASAKGEKKRWQVSRIGHACALNLQEIIRAHKKTGREQHRRRSRIPRHSALERWGFPGSACSYTKRAALCGSFQRRGAALPPPRLQ